jgi:hypothetical protein
MHEMVLHPLFYKAYSTADVAVHFVSVACCCCRVARFSALSRQKKVLKDRGQLNLRPFQLALATI